MFTAGVLIGMAKAILWTFQGVFVSYLAEVYASMPNSSYAVTVSKFFSTFYIVFQLSKYILI